MIEPVASTCFYVSETFLFGFRASLGSASNINVSPFSDKLLQIKCKFLQQSLRAG